MQKVVIDTNVIVSALIGSSFPRQIVYNPVFEKKIIVCTSTELFKEYIEVLNRDKFRKYPEFVTKAEIVLNKLFELSLKYIPSVKLSVIKDEPDNRVLELAVSAQADFIITGNTRDFSFTQYEGIRIVTPEQFIQLIY